MISNIKLIAGKAMAMMPNRIAAIPRINGTHHRSASWLAVIVASANATIMPPRRRHYRVAMPGSHAVCQIASPSAMTQSSDPDVRPRVTVHVPGVGLAGPFT
jgi:hypothetical protein